MMHVVTMNLKCNVFRSCILALSRALTLRVFSRKQHEKGLQRQQFFLIFFVHVNY